MRDESMASEQKDPSKLAEAFLPAEVETTVEPALVVFSGLPGTGKSYLSHILARGLGAVIVESDHVRKTIFSPPTYSAEESELVHRVCRIVAGRLLQRGANVVYDATNLVEFQREMIYHLADKSGARLVIVQTVAPEEVVRERLERRKLHENKDDISDADWRIYQSMQRNIGKGSRFGRNFIIVDTSGDSEEAVVRILRVIRKTGARKT